MKALIKSCAQWIKKNVFNPNKGIEVKKNNRKKVKRKKAKNSR